MAGEFDDLVPQDKQQQAPADNISGFADLIPSNQKQNGFMDMVDGFNNSVRKLANGVLQPIAAASDAIGITNSFSNRLKQDTTQYQGIADVAAKNSPYLTGTGAFLGDLAKIGFTGAATGGLGLGGYASPTLVSRMGQQGLLGLTEGVAENGSVDERFNRGMYQGAAGALGQAAGEAIGAGLKASGSKIANKLFTGRTANEAADLINSGEKLTAGTATGNEALQNAEGYLAQLPIVGAKGAYKNISNDVVQKAENLLADQGIDVTGQGISNASRGELAKSISNETIAAEKLARASASQKYNLAKEFAEQNNISIPLNAAKAQAEDILAMKGSLAKEGFKSLSGVGSEGNIIDDFIKNNKISATSFEDLRKGLNNTIQNLKKGNDPAGMAQELGKLKSAMDSDLVNAGESIGGKYNELLTNARNEYISKVTPFKEEPILKRIMAGNVTPDELLNAATMAEKPDTAKTLMSHLTPKGQEDYTKALLLNAAQDSFEKGSNKFSARKFNTALQTMGETLDVLPDKLKAQVKGLQAVMTRADDILKESGKRRVFAPGVTSAAALSAGGIAGLIGGGAITKTLSTLLTNPKMVNQLIRLGGGELNEKTSESTIKYILKSLGTGVKKATVPMIGKEVGGYLSQ